MPRIADLILAAGDARARGQRESGQIWGQTIGQLGQIAGSAVQQIPEMRAQQEAQQQEQALRALFDRRQPPSPDEIMAVVGPERGIKIAQGLQALQTDPRGDFQQTQTILRDVLLGMDSLPESVRAEHYALVRQSLVQRGVLKPEDAPEQYDPSWWAMTRQYGQEPEKRAGFTLSEGQTRFDASGQPVANVAKPPEKRSFKPVTLRGPNGRPMAALFVESDGKYYKPDGKTEIPDPTPYERPREGAQTSLQAKDVLNDAGQPVMATFDPRSGAWRDSAGQPIANPRPVPSAEATKDARKFRQADPILRSVAELSARINTQQGVYAKMRGGVEKQKAKINLDDDVAEYEALIQGFTPLVARALGHTGVLTQQDVDSVRMLFPKPGDSKTLRDRKVARIKSIIGQLQEDAKDSPDAPVPTDPINIRGGGS